MNGNGPFWTRNESNPMLRLTDVEFARGSTTILQGINLELAPGSLTTLLGPSGSGKTTLLQIIAGHLAPAQGTILINGRDATRLPPESRGLGMVHQHLALFPHLSALRNVSFGLEVRGLRREDACAKAQATLDLVGLENEVRHRLPQALSGGQRQRVCIARALALSPNVLIADEPTSALDLSTRSEILNLLMDIQRDSGQAVVLVSHDFATVRHLAHRIAVMYAGRVVEEGTAEDVTGSPRHPYTRALLSAVPVPNPDVQRARHRTVLHGDLPDPTAPPAGCRFRGRCPVATPACAEEDPLLVPVTPTHHVACLLHQPATVASQPVEVTP